jgi:hypothetical protein
MPKQFACPCDAFTAAVRGAFIEKLGDEHFLASIVAGGGGMQSTTYGPKIEFCPFCGASLAKAPELPRATAKQA